MSSAAFFFPLNIDLSIMVLVNFLVNFRTSWNFDRGNIESEDPFGESCHLNINNPRTQDFFHLLRSSGISFTSGCNFQSTHFFFTFLIKVILQHFVLLGIIVSGMILFHFWTAHCKCIEIQVILYIDLVILQPAEFVYSNNFLWI